MRGDNVKKTNSMCHIHWNILNMFEHCLIQKHMLVNIKVFALKPEIYCAQITFYYFSPTIFHSLNLLACPFSSYVCYSLCCRSSEFSQDPEWPRERTRYDGEEGRGGGGGWGGEGEGEGGKEVGGDAGCMVAVALWRRCRRAFQRSPPNFKVSLLP